MSTLEELRLAEIIVVDCQDHPGQWTIVASRVTPEYARPYVRRGCQVHCRPIAGEPELVDVIVRWPAGTPVRRPTRSEWSRRRG